MPDRTESLKNPNVNPDVSEYVWDIKTKRYKRNPDYRADSIAARYILWGVVVLVMMIAIIWCLRWT